MMLSLLLLAFADGAATAAPAAAPCATLQPACSEPPPLSGATLVTVTGRAGPATEAGSRADLSLARLNAVRTASGTRPVAPSDVLVLSAARHAAYLSDNGFRSAPSIHGETAGATGFSGADPFVRMRAAGYRSSYATEVVGDIGSVATDADCVDHLMNTIYHAALLLSRVTEAGVAYGTRGAAGACVIDLGAPLAPPEPQAAAPREIVRYPWPGMTMPTGSFHLASENPRPSLALLPAAIVGSPVLVGLRRAGAVAAGSGALGVELQTFELRDARDAPVPGVVLADAAITGPGVMADGALHGGFAVLMPRKPLAPGRYRVILHATIGADVVAPAPWTFVVAAP